MILHVLASSLCARSSREFQEWVDLINQMEHTESSISAAERNTLTCEHTCECVDIYCHLSLGCIGGAVDGLLSSKRARSPLTNSLHSTGGGGGLRFYTLNILCGLFC